MSNIAKIVFEQANIKTALADFRRYTGSASKNVYFGFSQKLLQISQDPSIGAVADLDDEPSIDTDQPTDRANCFFWLQEVGFDYETREDEARSLLEAMAPTNYHSSWNYPNINRTLGGCCIRVKDDLWLVVTGLTDMREAEAFLLLVAYQHKLLSVPEAKGFADRSGNNYWRAIQSSI